MTPYPYVGIVTQWIGSRSLEKDRMVESLKTFLYAILLAQVHFDHNSISAFVVALLLYISSIFWHS